MRPCAFTQAEVQSKLAVTHYGAPEPQGVCKWQAKEESQTYELQEEFENDTVCLPFSKGIHNEVESPQEDSPESRATLPEEVQISVLFSLAGALRKYYPGEPT